MATITWPLSLPQTLLMASYREAMESNLIVDTFETGPNGYRRRVSANVYPASGSMVMTTAEWEALQVFITNQTLDRQYAFGFPAQGVLTGQWLTLMDQPPTRKWLAEDLWEVTINLLVLPGLIASDADIFPSLFTDPSLFYAASFAGDIDVRALVRKAANQTAADYDPEAPVGWDTEVIDAGNWHTGSNSFFTVPSGVSYVRIVGTIVAQNVSGANPWTLRIGKGGTPWNAYFGEAAYKTQSGGTNAWLNVASPVLPVTAGNTFDLLFLGDGSCDIVATRSSFAISSVSALTFSGALVRKTSAQTGVMTSMTKVQYNAEVYDIGGWHDNITNNTRLTVPVGVSYVRLTACQAISGFAGGQWIVGRILKNNAITAFMPRSLHESSGVMWNTFSSPVLPVLAGEYFEHEVQIEADVLTTIDADRTSFSIEAVDPATFSGALITKSVNQTAANYTAGVAVTWDDEGGGGYDIGGWHSTSLDTSRFTVPSGVSHVRLRASLDVANASTGGVLDLIRLRKNGSEDFDGNPSRTLDVTASIRTHNLCSPVLDVVPGDYFELYYTISTDTSIDILADTSWFAIEKIA